MPAVEVPQLLVTAREAAQVLRVCPGTLCKLRKGGFIKSVKIGRARRYPVAALQAYVGGLMQNPQQRPGAQRTDP